MSGLAKVLLKNGAAVSGSDMENSAVVEELNRMGANIAIGHNAANLPEKPDAVVISAAIKISNPELAKANQQGSTVLKYASMLGEMMDLYRGIAVCGTHGKSTTSGWLAYLMDKCGSPANYIVGANVTQLGNSSGVANSEYFIAEACEYDRSFLNLKPEIAVVLNIEQDHLDYYKDEDDIVQAFTDFAGGVKPGGTVILNGQDPNVRRILESLPNQENILTFGLDGSYDYSAKNIKVINGLCEFDLYAHGQRQGLIKIALPGRHNILNALAVIAACDRARLDLEKVCANIGTFTGIDRRMMFRGVYNGVTVVDDYAHHPTEIRAALAGLRERYQPQRLWCVFQPHQYSRTRFLLDDFAESFKLSDITIVPEIYFVRDTAESRQKVSAETLVKRIRSNGSEAVFINDFADIVKHLNENVRPGDMVVTMGAGTIWKVADEFIQGAGKHS